LSKFYQSVLASERDQHLRRVLWRGGDGNTEPKVYKTRTVNFGDKPAGCVALTAVRATSDLYSFVDEEAAEKLKDDNYCDDIASGAESKEEALRVSEDMNKIVSYGGFSFKSTVMSGDDREPMKILGTGWDTRTDTLFIEVKVNISPKRKGVRTKPNIEFHQIQESFPAQVTKRVIWRIVLGQFDLLGLACVFFIRLKLLMRDLSGEEGRKIGWDDEVPQETRDRFVQVLQMMGEMQQVKFPRCIKPDGAKKGQAPELLMFGDGSKQAFCSLAYLRWEMEDGGFKCFLVSGKTRVAPLRKISVPRIELLGAVASVRLAESVQESLKIQIGRRFFFTDSSAVFGMIRGECAAYQEFVGTRTGEIKSKSDPESEWFWLPSQENLADLGTRDDVMPSSLHPYSIYLNGTLWMREHFDVWPVNQNPGKVPEEEIVPAAQRILTVGADPIIINLSKFNSFKKVVRITALVFKFIEMIKGKNKSINPTLRKQDFEQAENYWFIFSQSKICKDLKASKLTSLLPRISKVSVMGRDHELIVTSGRLGGALIVGYDKEELPILDPKSAVAKLIMHDSHAEEHCGVDRTLWRSRNVAWIIRGRRIAKAIRGNCFKCKLRGKVLEKQIMAPVPESRLPPAPVFYSTAVDLFGPIEIRDTVKRRTARKCWGVLFCCTVTSAVHLEVSEDYSCDSFLLCLRRFINLRGVPARIQSDPGSQLMAAAAELGKWDFSRIHEWASGMKTEWHVVPTDSQHFNGCAEAMIKITKRQLTENLKNKNFTKGELDTFLSDVIFIINSRPLMRRAGEDVLSGPPITPLHLLGGRCTQNIPLPNLDENPRLSKRLRFLEETKQEFWKKWFLQVFHNLVPVYKWRKEHRDVQVGDVVLLKDSNLLRGEYRMARVKDVVKGEDGHVRRVKLEYKNLQPTGSSVSQAVKDLQSREFQETERSIHNVAVIVPADWTDEEIETAVTSGLNYKCAF